MKTRYIPKSSFVRLFVYIRSFQTKYNRVGYISRKDVSCLFVFGRKEFIIYMHIRVQLKPIERTKISLICSRSLANDPTNELTNEPTNENSYTVLFDIFLFLCLYGVKFRALTVILQKCNTFRITYF